LRPSDHVRSTNGIGGGRGEVLRCAGNRHGNEGKQTVKIENLITKSQRAAPGYL